MARELFYWRGIHAAGVDTIAREADVAPTTLYRMFGSKDGLLGAYLDREAQGHREWFERALGDPERSAGERIVNLFTALTELVQPDNCRGCPFQMALAETPDGDRPAHRSAVEVKLWVRDRFRALAAQHLGAEAETDPAARCLADHLTLLFEGAFASAQSIVANGPPQSLRAIAERIVR